MGALAVLLEEQGVNVLICGGLGGGAQTALAEAGIEVCSGASGDADQAVESYLKGELASAGVNCDHHHGKAILVEAMKKVIPVVAAAAVAHSRRLQVKMWEKPAERITEEPLMMVHSLILLMTGENLWNLHVEQAR